MISSISIKRFGIHEEREFELSPGVTLLIGGNGTGKTTIVQALVWAIWGKPLRPFELAAGAEVKLRFDSPPAVDGTRPWNLVRRITARGESVDLLGSFQNSNKTRAAESLESLFGQWDAWKRTLHATGKSVSRFSTGTAGDKFEHLVAITGADMFDTAATALKLHLDEFDGGPLALAITENTKADQACAAAYRIIQRHKEESTNVGVCAPVEQLQARFDELSAQLSAATANEDAAGNHYREARKREEQVELRMRTVDRKFMATTRGTCETCNQSVPLPGDEAIQKELDTLRAEYRELNKIRAQHERTWSEANAYKGRLFSGLQPISKELNEATASEWMLSKIEKERVQRIHELLTARSGLLQTSSCLDELNAQRQKILAAGQVIKGARRRHLMGYVVRIENFANYYLTTIGSKLRVKLSFDKNKLNIGVSGVGGKDYESISSGEQRRVDICLILAMGQAAAETGTVPSSAPLVIDEAFDTLDADGIEALISLACEIAKTRQVILISHAEPGVPTDPGVWKINL